MRNVGPDGIPEFDREGRVLITEFAEFVILNIYFPNGNKDKERLQYKLDFYKVVSISVLLNLSSDINYNSAK